MMSLKQTFYIPQTLRNSPLVQSLTAQFKDVQKMHLCQSWSRRFHSMNPAFSCAIHKKTTSTIHFYFRFASSLQTKSYFTTRHVCTDDNSFQHNAHFETIDEEINVTNRRFRNLLVIQKTSDRGWGLYAKRTFDLGDKIFSSKAISSSTKRSSHSIQTGCNTHVTMDLPARFINHSCDANTGIQDNEFGAYDFYAMRTIYEGEELTLDYETTESEISAFEKCFCESDKCRVNLKGFDKHGEVLRKQYGKHIANHLLLSR